MKAKMIPSSQIVDRYPVEVLNPFVHRGGLEFTSMFQRLLTYILTITVLPLRCVAIAMLLVMAWFLASLGLFGMSEKELRTKPMSGWRRALLPYLCSLGISAYEAGGLHVRIKGRQASRREAPILVVAPHSTFLDAVVGFATGLPSIISRTGINPYIGKLINYTQPVYVWREDPNSRQNTIKEIIRRATSDEDWPQILIFPEGTCTNRTCLITFKPGAFYPGVPVQPVCVKYPNKLDTVTWTWEGPGALKLLWMTLTRFHSYCEIEFLPVYVPNEAEKRDPKLFANNVRQRMADALGIPVTDYTYDDCRLMSRAKHLQLPYSTGLVEIQKLRGKLGLTQSKVEDELLPRYAEIANPYDGKIGLKDLADYLKLPYTDPELQRLFMLYDRDGSGKIDFREYLLGFSLISNPANTEETIQLAFKIFDRGSKGAVTEEDLARALKCTLGMPAGDVHRLFRQIDMSKKGYITYNEFKSHAQRKPEYAKIFTAYQAQLHNKLTKINGNSKGLSNDKKLA